jgi:hypothetical protein
MQKQQRENAQQSKPVSAAESVEFARIAQLLRSYRELKQLLEQSRRETVEDADALWRRMRFLELAKLSPNADALLKMYAMPRRDASLRRMVLSKMKECSARREPTPLFLIEFMEGLLPTHKTEATIREENSKFESKALCFTLLKFARDFNQRFDNKFLSHVVFVSQPTIQTWREQFEKFDPESETAVARRIEAHLESSRGWSTWWEGWLKKNVFRRRGSRKRFV